MVQAARLVRAAGRVPAERRDERAAGRREAAGPGVTPDFLTELFQQPVGPGLRRRGRPVAGRRRRPAGWRGASARAAAIVVVVAVGFLFAVAYRQTMADEPSRSQARAALVAQIKQREAETDELTARAGAAA